MQTGPPLGFVFHLRIVRGPLSSATPVPPRPSGATPPLAAVPALTPEPDTRLLVLLLLAAVLLPRLLVLPFNENLYGDAVVRTENAERRAREPHINTA